MIYDKMVALVGSAGAGKTYISNIFRQYGVPVFNTDECAKTLMNEDKRIISNLKSKFGAKIYNKDKKLNKDKLRELIFKNEKNLEFVEALVHPAVWKQFMDWKFEKIFIEHKRFVIMENAILTKSENYKLFKYAILVDAPIKIRQERIMTRDGMTKEKMQMIFDNQESPTYVHSKLSSAGVHVNTIINNGVLNVEERIRLFIDIFRVGL